MKVHMAFVCEQGARFAVVLVRPSVMSGLKREREDAVRAYSDELGVPAVLMIQNSRGTPTYYGRADLVACLAGVCVEQLHWRECATQAA